LADFLSAYSFRNLQSRIRVPSVAGTDRPVQGDAGPMTDVSNGISASGAARLLGLSESTLAKLRVNGNGPAYCKLGRRVVYRAEDLQSWRESRLAHNTSDADARLPKSLTGTQPQRGRDDRDHIKARLAIQQSSTPARATLVPENEEHKVVASKKGTCRP
jgi:predicted DNA-binding transcriptional regulator AlpA